MMFLPRKLLLRLLGALWLIDGLLQLQPQMFTMNMIQGVMAPVVQDQPAPIAASLQWIINVTTQHLVVVNLLIGVAQILIGFGLLTLSGQWVKRLLIASIVWALIVWYAGEGMSMLLTGQGSILTGAPGAVLLYPLLGLVVYPRQSSPGNPTAATAEPGDNGVLSRALLRKIFAGFWVFAALLQLQPYWWQPRQISQTIAAMVGQGGLNSILVDPVLQHIAIITSAIEIPLNCILILTFLGLGLALLMVKEERLLPVLIASMIACLVLWYAAEAFGMIFTGMATDFNSGLLLIITALACLPKPSAPHVTHERPAHNVQETRSSAQSA